LPHSRFDAIKIHSRTFALADLPTALRYARDGVDHAITLVVTMREAEAGRAAA
jgi:L-iditol 2-dehydrogenase